MSTRRYIREVGTVEGSDGERLAVGIEDDTVAVYVGGWQSADGCRLNAVQAEDFAALFVHAVWQAGRQSHAYLNFPDAEG